MVLKSTTEEEIVTQADIIVLPPSKVDDQSDCETVDKNELVSSETLPNDVAELILMCSMKLISILT